MMLLPCRVFAFVVLLLAKSNVVVNAELAGSQDCTSVAELEIDAAQLTALSAGNISDANVQLVANDEPASPGITIEGSLGENITFSLDRPDDDIFFGYLVRVRQDQDVNPFAYFVQDSGGFGAAAFCSALGFLDTTNLTLTSYPLVNATFWLYFDGVSDLDLVMDLIVVTDSDYSYYMSQYDIHISEEDPFTPEPSIAPSTSNEPSTEPSLQPSTGIVASLSPTEGPTRMPSRFPTITTLGPVSAATLMPSLQTPTQTRQTTVSPTFSVTGAENKRKMSLSPSISPLFKETPALNLEVEVSPPPTRERMSVETSTFDNIRISLAQVSELNDDARIKFEETTALWYERIYDFESAQRRLQESGIFYFATSISVVGQAIVDENNNTLTYNQVISYQQIASAGKSDPRDIILSPFVDDDLRRNYIESLRESHAVFSQIPLDSPVPVQIDSPTWSQIQNEEGGTADILLLLGMMAALCAVFGGVILFVRFVRHSRRQRFVPIGKDERSNVETDRPISDIFWGDDDVSGLHDPSLGPDDGLSYDAENSLSTVDYDYVKISNGSGARSVVSSSGGTVGADTRQETLTQSTVVHQSRWSHLGKDYANESNIRIVGAPPGKLGIVVDTPDQGPPVIHTIKGGSPLEHLVRIGDRLLTIDDTDVTGRTAIDISRIISKKSTNDERLFTVMRFPTEEESSR